MRLDSVPLHVLAILLFGAPNVTAGGAEAWTSEKQLLEQLQGGAEAEELPLLRVCITRSWWGAARELVARVHRRISAGDAGGVESLSSVKAEVESLLTGVKNNADSFAAYAEQTYRGQTAGITDEVPCALQWAQNSTAVFLGVKYAARWSAPGAIEVTDVNVNTSDCCFFLGGYGHHSSIRKHYLVNLTLFADVDPERTSWSSASVGRLTATLHKKTAHRWPGLTKSAHKSRHQITKWLDMAEKWEEELRKNAPSKHDEKPAAKPTPAPTPPPAASKKTPKKALTPSQKEWAKRWKKLRTWLRKLQGNPSACAAVASVALLLTVVLCRRCCGRSRGPVKAKAEEEATAADEADDARQRAAQAALARAEADKASTQDGS